MSWRLANSLVKLRDEIKAISPNQTIYSIGDTKHQAGASDHNPNAAGVVCAIDIMQGNGLDLQAVANYLVAHPHRDLKYVIHNRKIASKSQGWRWRTYTGSDPHTDHIHVSVGVGSDGRSAQPYDDTTAWGVSAAVAPGAPKPAPAPGPKPTDKHDPGSRQLRLTSPQLQGTDVAFVQGKVGCKADGIFGPDTDAHVRAYQKAHKLDVDGVVGPATWKALLAAPKPAPKPASGTYAPGSRTVKKGDKGNDVAYVQRFIGPDHCGVADGDFGAKTEAGVKWYQRMRGIAADGVVGPVTWRNILGH